MNHVYCVRYRLYRTHKEQLVDVLARNKFEAYDKAVYEVIPEKEGHCPYSAWVSSVTYNSGTCHKFNTCEGMPW